MKGIYRGALCIWSLSLSFNLWSRPSLETETLHAMEVLKAEYNLPSLSVAIGKGEDVAFAKAIGFADIETKKKADSNTQYSVGSLAKPMTGIALAKLVDSNRVNLNAKVSEYVKKPSYTNLFTVEELAAHLAGVPHDTPERNIAEFFEVKDHLSPFDAFYVFDSHPLLFNPGTAYKYSSNGYILLSAVIEAAAKTNYVTFLKESIWHRFAMSSTQLDTSVIGKNTEASYYAEVSTEGKFLKAVTKRDRSFLFGGGGFISTPSDLVKMSQATYHDDFLSPHTKEILYSPVALRSGESNRDDYSLGWRVNKIKLDSNANQWIALHHGGVTDKASTSYLLVVPECQASIAFATNYVPEKFWRIRGKMAAILKKYINESDCMKISKPVN